jgi:N-acyl-D-amino-acid deacylase
MHMLSWVIRNAEVVDGAGGESRRVDVGIKDDKIARIGEIAPAEMPPAERVLDAAGSVLSPGFIDMHSHSDLTLPTHKYAESSLCQGITTEVAGSCGWSLAPVKDETQRGVLRGLLKGLTGISSRDLKFAWHSFAEYAAYLAKQGTGTNLYPVLGQSLLRAHVVGKAKRTATPEETAAMRAMLREAMREGCRGLSTGRSYLPGGNAPTEEIVALCEELPAFDGIYTSHIKNESTSMLDAVGEVITIGRMTGAKVQVSHHKVIGPANQGRVVESLALMDAARRDGVDITCDVYPYDFAQVYLLRDGLVREWRGVSEAKVMERLADPEYRAALRTKAGKGKGSELVGKPENYLLVDAPGAEQLEGLNLEEVAKRLGGDVVDACSDLLVTTHLQAKIAAVMAEEDVQTVLRHPLTMVGTDAFAIDGVAPGTLPLHPRHYGTFPRVVGHYGRDLGFFSLSQAVHKVTGLPAAKLGLTDRGVLRVGAYADLVIFDADTILDLATGKLPTVRPSGISDVFVNGERAMAAGVLTKALAGKVLTGRG